jgi:hypothetical protein
MQTRRRFKQTKSFQDRLSEFVEGARSEADAAPGGADQYELQKKIRQAENAANIEAWRTRRNCSRRSDGSEAWLLHPPVRVLSLGVPA